MSEKKEKKAINELSVACIRALLLDEIDQANSGHPGMALDAAPALFTLFANHLVADPKHPDWVNRDRFVLSAGHCSALYYAMLHVAGYDLPLEELKRFRQLGSLTPGHPEYRHTAGVDATAGPLGQGISQAVGMAMAEAHLRASYSDGDKLFNHFTYCLCGDGCLEEGISQEAISLAGHFHLNKLIMIYDANGSTLDGPTDMSLSESIKTRFLASGWDVINVKDGNNIDKIDKAIAKAKKSLIFPTLIIVHTKIGFGTSKEGSHSVHGSPLGFEESTKAKINYGFDKPSWTVPEEVKQNLRDSFAKRGEEAYEAYEKALASYKEKYPEEFAQYEKAINGEIEEFLPEAPVFDSSKKEAGRSVCGVYLNKLHEKCHFTFGGSADVAGSTKTDIKNELDFSFENPEGSDINWGIREFAMAGAQNGILLHKGLKSYVSCFLVFSDYMKSAIRMSCLEKIPAIYIFTHDSLAVGEDGPTHQPIEQLASLRSIPGMFVYRPADSRECWESFNQAFISKENPSALILTRQNLPLLENSSAEGVRRGGYVVYSPSKKPTCQILATGSEVSLAIEASKLLEEKRIFAEVVSMPCLERFDRQDDSYKEEILHLPYEKRVSLEMASTFGWHKYAKNTIGIDEFGASAPEKDVLAHFGFEKEAVASKIEKLLGR